MIVGLFFFLSHKRLTPLYPFAFSIPICRFGIPGSAVSGTSTNPARSFGPSLVAGVWQGWWLYWLGPMLAALFALVLIRSNWLGVFEIEVAKLYHFEHDPYKVFHWLEEITDL